MNSYFRLVIEDNKTFIELFPATDGGAELDINEITAYLQLKRIMDYDLTGIYKELNALKDEPVKVMAMKTPAYAENETCFLTFSDDKMQVFARFVPPSNLGSRMDKNEILSDLAHQKVVYGIKEDAIDAFIKNPQYCTDIVVAEGLAPRHGTDAYIEYFFDTKLSTAPARNEDGSVDFFNLNTINHCKEGELLAKLHKQDPGDYGMNVLGSRIKPRDVKKMRLSFGNKITLSEDKTEIYSDVNGHVMLTGGKVFVSDVYEVENVGTATGNITSEGSVLVNGNVQSGFEIKAVGNVEVKGIVEGAKIEAGGDIIISKGMNGMGKGVLIAGGNVITKFVENSEIVAGGCVESDSIMHSTVNAKTHVKVDGRKGFIAGGVVRATQSITCKTLGSEMGADTVVEVGVDPQQKARYVEVQKELRDLTTKQKTIQSTLDGALARLRRGDILPKEQTDYIKQLITTNRQMLEMIDANEEEFCELSDMMDAREDANVVVRGEAYVGAKVVIGEDMKILKSNMQYVRFKDIGGEVKASSI